ncbi:T9SS type A sorting domain-containing protein [Soonwooa sp.]|uniref:T9SS type A sorting domain-containing protein n=1 Tax=Soonwooa sp. TaxID=1938592 RepID=UPI00261EE35F|nr:T9SS type A sorting domain-containing protein [Soonwooa sp.]
MNKKLFISTLSILLFSQSISAQETKISFETSEGFTLGNFNGQKGWSNWGYVDETHSQVVNTIAADGANSVEVTADEAQEENWGGIFYNAPAYRRMSISADIYLDKLTSADYDMLTLYSMDVDDYERIGGFYYSYNASLEVGDDTTSVIKTWQAKKWYNLKVNIDFNTKKIEYYLDNVKLTTSTFNSEINSIKEFDFEFDNYKSGFKVDNVKIQNLDNLATAEIDKNVFQVYPNPSSDFINIKGVKDVEQISIFDGSGILIYQSNSFAPIDVKAWKSGLYLIKIKTKNTEVTTKFIKQ